MKKHDLPVLSFIIGLGLLFLNLLPGCTNFHDGGGSVWQDGLWILPTLTAIGAGIFGYKAYKAHNSGSNVIESGAITDKEGGKVPYNEIGYTWFSVGLILATILIIIGVNGSK